MQSNRLLYLAIALSVISAGLLAVGAANLRRSPEQYLSVEQPVQEFRDTPSGETIAAQFTVKNASSVPLMTTVRKDCTCTAAILGKSRLMPGESTTLDVSFKSTGFRGAVKNGALLTASVEDQSGTVRVVDTLRVALSGTIIPAFVTEPDVLLFTAGFNERKTVSIRPGHVEQFGITGVRARDPAFTAVMVPDSSEADTKAIEVTFDSSKWSMTLGGRDELIIDTDSPLHPSIAIAMKILPGIHQAASHGTRSDGGQLQPPIEGEQE